MTELLTLISYRFMPKSASGKHLGKGVNTATVPQGQTAQTISRRIGWLVQIRRHATLR